MNAKELSALLETKLNARLEGLWANINAKKKRGEKSAPKGSKAYKAAKKAGDELEKTKESFELEKEKFTTPDQMRMHKEAKAPGYNVVYRDKAFDKTYTAQIPPGISKAEIVKMLKKTIRVGLEVVSIQPMKESAPGYKHDCAAKVVHEKYGKGNTIPEKHTLVKEGSKYVVTHYDVLFENGNTVLDIPVNELKIETTNEHWHKGYKKKKK